MRRLEQVMRWLWVAMVCGLFGLCLLEIISPAMPRELYPGQYDSFSPELRHWFRSQKSPKTGGLCCSEADGTYAEEDIRGGHYYTRWIKGQDWLQVPDDVVIHDPNRNGAPVVWYYHENGEPRIRCYAPGALM